LGDVVGVGVPADELAREPPHARTVAPDELGEGRTVARACTIHELSIGDCAVVLRHPVRGSWVTPYGTARGA
jgi:hypothetical protein